jgi:Zinc knuckle
MGGALTPRAGFLKKRWEQKDKQGVQCYNCQKYGHITKECFQKKNPCTPQPGPLTQARKTHQEEESDDKAKEQANVILWQMGEASNWVKGYVARTIGEGFWSA